MATLRPVVTVFVRHQGDCRYANRQGRAFARDCNCVKWLRYSGEACFCRGRNLPPHRQHRLTTGSRSWSIADDQRAELQRKLNTGESGTIPPAVETKQQTVKQSIETFITAKESEGASVATVRKLRHQLGLLEEFLSKQSKAFPSEITEQDLIAFRAGWKWESGVTRQKAQQNVRGFLRFCHRADVLPVLKKIELSKADKERLKPKPFTEKELKALLAQVPVTFAEDSAKATKLTALIHFMVSTGVAIRDAVQLERSNIADGWLRIERQKTDKAVRQKLDAGLHRELLAVANSNPRYVFWNGTSLPTSATGLWQRYMLRVMKDAGLWIPGNLFHRFRDTAVDFWLGKGCSMTEIAAMLGDTVAIVERHYADLACSSSEPVRPAWPRGQATLSTPVHP
jgi:site-specific recombinase XerD